MYFRILGPIELCGPTATRSISAARQRAVLGMMLIDADRVVSTDQLAYALWDNCPPGTAKGQIQICVSALRKTLAAMGLPDRIVTRPPGYLLHVEDGELDLHAFERLATAGQQAATDGRIRQAAAAYAAALALWRGSALAGVDSRPLAAAAARLDERRLNICEELIDLRLRLGQHHDVIGDLRELIAAHPLRERLHAQQMRAFFGAGRQGEALAAYRSARQTFIQELGLEPGGELRNLERAILNGQDAVALAVPEVPVVARGPGSVPRTLPADTADFVGRAAALASILDRLRAGGGGAVRPRVAVSGRAGTGKTILAVHAAHALHADFPDGQLYLNLQGGTATPLPTRQALDRLLRATGLPRRDLPGGLDERAELFRDRIAGRRVLVILDDAADEKQVAPLLPGSSANGVLLTARRRLTALAGVHQVHLGVLDTAASLDLLAMIAGADRVRAEPDAARHLVRLCDRLPLAVRIAAARLAARPHWTLARLVERLADEDRRLDELASGGLDVRSSLASSYLALPPAARELLGMLCQGPEAAGGHPLGRLPARLAAAPSPAQAGPPRVSAPGPGRSASRAAVRPDARTVEVLEELVDAQLVTATHGRDGEPGYRIPGLVRCFAREQAAAGAARRRAG